MRKGKYKAVRPGDRLIQDGMKGLKRVRAPQGSRPPAVAPSPLPAETRPLQRSRRLPDYPVIGPELEPQERSLPAVGDDRRAPKPPVVSRHGGQVLSDLPFLQGDAPRVPQVQGDFFDEQAQEKPDTQSPEIRVRASGSPICPLAGEPCIGVYCQWFDVEDICAILSIKKDLALLRQVPAALEVLEVRLGRISS